jgi:hypothetical protein
MCKLLFLSLRNPLSDYGFFRSIMGKWISLPIGICFWNYAGFRDLLSIRHRIRTASQKIPINIDSNLSNT